MELQTLLPPFCRLHSSMLATRAHAELCHLWEESGTGALN